MGRVEAGERPTKRSPGLGHPGHPTGDPCRACRTHPGTVALKNQGLRPSPRSTCLQLKADPRPKARRSAGGSHEWQGQHRGDGRGPPSSWSTPVCSGRRWFLKALAVTAAARPPPRCLGPTVDAGGCGACHPQCRPCPEDSMLAPAAWGVWEKAGQGPVLSLDVASCPLGVAAGLCL